MAHWLGAPARLGDRYPVFTLDACPTRCARNWVEARGSAVQRSLLLAPAERDDLQSAVKRLAAEGTPPRPRST